MTATVRWAPWLVVASACAAPAATDRDPVTTSGTIAIANLDHQIAQRRDEPDAAELLLARSRYLGDYDALDRAVELTEPRGATRDDLIRRARTRAAAHRFSEALADLAAADAAGAGGDDLAGLRASILVATGRAGEAIPGLEAAAVRRPGYATWSALATAYAAGDRIADADRLYLAAAGDLDTTSPFPHAWIAFARGRMWADRARDPARAEALFGQALRILPGFTAAAIELAEREAARGDLASAIARLERIVADRDEPEALGLLGALRLRTGDPARAALALSRARLRFESLLQRHLLAFADHAAEFYLGAGGDPERGWSLAERNLAARPTVRAFALAIAAARATGRDAAARELAARASAAGAPPPPAIR